MGPGDRTVEKAGRVRTLMNRAEMLQRAKDRDAPWDVIVIGGGATGAGVAVDAADRGYSVLLVERWDFGSGTSTRSTKLVHGGVRYLRQGRVGMVLDALRERGRLRRNAPHLVHDLAFVLPCYSRWDVAKYAIGLAAYDLLGGRSRFGHSKVASRAEVVRRLPTARTEGLRGGVVYHDGRFDDAALLIALIRTAADLGAVVLNYAPAVRLIRGPGGAVSRVVVHDLEGGDDWRATARVVVNAAGPFCDDIRRLADPSAPPILAVSRGSHVVLDRSFLPSDDALLVPETPDGRVLFVIPWHGSTLIGTTEVPVPAAEVDPRASPGEIDFILETAGRYLVRQPSRADVRSTFAGIRPLVKAARANTASLSRDHAIRIDAPGLVTITGGKWTTYRKMAEDTVTRAADLAGLPERPCRTVHLSIHDDLAASAAFGRTGSGSGELLHPALPYCVADVTWAARYEMARTVEDVLARRTRAVYLDAAAAEAVAPRVAKILALELNRDEGWVAAQVRSFVQVARNALPPIR
jgi:glycerol-3-phosphate dehydrogenase